MDLANSYFSRLRGRNSDLATFSVPSTGKMLVKDYGFEYLDENQKEMNIKFKNVFGKDFWLRKYIEDCILWVGFLSKHELSIQLECKSEEDALALIEKFEKSKIKETNSKYVILEGVKLHHWDHDSTYTSLKEILSSVLKTLECDYQRPCAD